MIDRSARNLYKYIKFLNKQSELNKTNKTALPDDCKFPTSPKREFFGVILSVNHIFKDFDVFLDLNTHEKTHNVILHSISRDIVVFDCVVFDKLTKIIVIENNKFLDIPSALPCSNSFLNSILKLKLLRKFIYV